MTLLFSTPFHFYFLSVAITPALIELAKILAVSFGWIGALALFMWWKDRRKTRGNVRTVTVSRAA
jgi:hypothetical protein